MVYKNKYRGKRYGRRRRTNTKRQYTRRKFGMTKSLNYKGVVFWKEKYQIEIPMVVQAGTNTFCGYQSFKLGDLNNVANFQRMWDYYKITGVKVTVFPMNASVPVVNASGLSQYVTPQLAMKVDYDAGAVWQTWQQALESSARVWQLTGDRTRKLYIKPRINQLAQETPTTPGANVVNFSSSKVQNWVDTRFDDVEYHGIQIAVHNPPNSSTDEADLQVLFTYYIAFKGHL